jgi:ubiquinone/menaquinone biosynthesis C-methylase UbiE
MAMDGSDKEIFPYLPFIVQDLWELGADPSTVIKLISKRFTNCAVLKVLDLECGKGAVSIRVAEKLGYSCFGIDAIPDFKPLRRTKRTNKTLAIYVILRLATFEKRLKRCLTPSVTIIGCL